MYYKLTKLKFECTACGQCCYGDKDSYIELGDEEAEKIRVELNISNSWLRKRYLTRLEDGSRGVRIDENGRCVFLGKGEKCRIYDVRPTQCRTYPFWPELVQTRSAWLNEASRCEGINKGKSISIRYIESCLKEST